MSGFVNYDLDYMRQNGGTPRRPIPCDSCKRARRKCDRPQTMPLPPCAYCNSRGQSCVTSQIQHPLQN
ncbi:uncharacterized protein FOMMEDRAFT_151101 [Fomitiporia mediterranea MF3/22]|uniref:uncharacterized protein n=1 Tax=Fomitiporia mediterranea (strain MF3/22) TaxID=694068 RepID=UPI0004409B11|nr:uncharacterized protein FOMMEDRAFT_151101 [Fomitiporia mediterranea MF3/22]EJD08327.1 hypothetical protein FOMMEDRAFT_151101 [Fomitiporia mediterranea MF3/22]